MMRIGEITVGTVLALCCAVVAQTVSLPDSICKAGTVPVKYSGNINLNFTEGPAADAAGDLFFTAPNSSQIWKIPASGAIPAAPFLSNTNGAEGLTFDAQDRLVAGQHGMLTRYNADGSVDEVLAQATASMQFGNINDLTMGTQGQIYFSNSGSQVFYRDPTTGTVSVAATGFAYSNGIFLVEEDSMMYVDDNGGTNLIYKYHVTANGALSNRTQFATVNVPDGIRVDIDGNVYCAANGDKTVVVFNKSGVLLGKIDLSAVTQYTTNCAFGGPGNKTLYITGSNAVYAVTMQIPGRRLSTMITGAARGNAGRAPQQGYNVSARGQTLLMTLPSGSSVGCLGVFDLRGRLVEELLPFVNNQGQLTVAWDRGAAARGEYVIRPLAGGAAAARSLAVVGR